MKKKLFLSLLIVLLCFVLVGCGSSSEEDNDDVKDDSLVVINGLDFKLDQEKEYKGLKYIITGDFKENITDHYVEYRYYQEDGSNLLFYRVFFYEGKDNAYARQNLGIEDKFQFEDGKINDIEYKLIDEKRTDGTIHFYFINKNNNTYVLHFVSQHDIKDFESKVLNSIKFE